MAGANDGSGLTWGTRRRAKKCIVTFERKIFGANDDSSERKELNDIVRGALEVAAQQLTTTEGAYLNTSYRSGSPDSYRRGTSALTKRMVDRFRNKMIGLGTNFFFAKTAEEQRKREEKRKQAVAKAAAPAAKATSKTKKQRVGKTVNQTTRMRATIDEADTSTSTR